MAFNNIKREGETIKMENNVNERLKQIVAKNLRIGISIEEINDNSNLISDFLFDSIQVLRLIADIEREFDIVVENEYLVIETLTRYSSLREYVESKTKSC